MAHFLVRAGRGLALATLLLGAFLLCFQAASALSHGAPLDPDTRDALAQQQRRAASSHGLHEAGKKRDSELARAPDGTALRDHSLHAHGGVNDGLSDDAASGPNGAQPRSVSLWLLLAMTLVMSLLAGVGAMPYLFTGKLEPYWSGIANAVGCGVMLAASFDLLEEAKSYSPILVMGGIILGVLAMAYSQAWLGQFEDVSFSDLQGADARKTVLILGVMAAHAFGEGSGVGVSFSGPRGWAQGLLVTIAIGLHNIPEGMAVATIMVARGTPPRTALFWTLLSALPQGIVAVPAYVFVETFSGLLPIALGFAAGCMIWIVFAELIPDALETAEHAHVATAATLSAATLQFISMMIAKLERPDGTVASPIQADLSVLGPGLGVVLLGLAAAPAAAAAASSLLPSLPLTLGASAGVGAWLSLAALFTSVLHHKNSAVLWAAGGAVSCALLWRMVTSTTPATGEKGGKDSDGEKDEEGALGSKHLQHLHKELGYANGQEHQQQPHHVVPHHGGGDGAAHASAAFMQHANGHFQPVVVNGWSVPPPPPGSSPQSVQGFEAWDAGTVHATGVAGRQGQVGLERRTGYSFGNSGGGGLGEAPLGAVHCAANCRCKECDAKLSHGGSVHLDLMPAADRPRECVRAALLLGGMLLLAVLPEGYQAAAALLGHLGDAGTLLVPLALRAVPFGVAAVGVVRAGAGTTGWQLPVTAAASLAGVAAITAASLLLGLPCGRQPADTIGFDPAGVLEKLRAFAAGGLLLASVGYMLPAAAHFKPKRVQLGAVLGVASCAAVSLLSAGLCAATPYCLVREGTHA